MWQALIAVVAERHNRPAACNRHRAKLESQTLPLQRFVFDCRRVN
jgi:hypothetical protein